MFMFILKEARASERFPDELIAKRGPPPAPLQLQIAAAFRYLAKGCPVTANEEAAGLGKSTMQHFNAPFFEWFAERYYVEWVTSKIPTDAPSLARLMKPYAMCGMPGAVASRDGVRITSQPIERNLNSDT